MGNSESQQTNDSVNLKMSKEQYNQYMQYLHAKKNIEKRNDKKKLSQKKQLVQNTSVAQRSKKNIQNNRPNPQKMVNYQNQEYNSNKKNIDNGLNNYQMFSNRIHTRSFNNVVGENTYNSRENIRNNLKQPINNSYINHNVNSRFQQSNNSNNRPSFNHNMNNAYRQRSYKTENNQNNYRQNSFDQNNIIKKCDPFNILKSNKNISLEELKNKYKKLALIHHPDRGGDVNKFNILIDAYNNITKLIEKNKSDKSHYQLKSSFTSDNENQQKLVNVNMKKKFNINKFNDIYQNNKLEDYNDYGYGDIMEKSSAIRDDIEIKRQINKYSKNTFNNQFNSEKKTRSKNTIVKYTPPKPVEKNSLNFSVLGEGKKNNYTSNGSKLNCTDYREAHIDNYLIDPNSVNYKTYKNVEELKKYRKSNTKLTEEERKIIEEIKEQEDKEEWERINRLKEQDHNHFKHFQEVNRLMLN